MRIRLLAGDVFVEVGPRGRRFEAARLFVEAPDGIEFFGAPEARGCDRLFQDRDGPVVHAQRDGEGMAVLAAMREGKAGRIAEAAGRSMEHLCDRRERLHRPGTDTGLQQQLGEIARPGFPGGGERAVQATEEDVGSADLVMGRHLQAGQLQNRDAISVVVQFRTAAGGSVHIAVNGGYRSPAHKMAIDGSPHMWGTAADTYRIGSSILKTKELIDRFNDVAEELSDDVVVMPYGHETGKTVDDHVHIDLGYLTVIPREISEDRMEVPQEHRPRFAFEERRKRERRVPQPVAAGSENENK